MPDIADTIDAAIPAAPPEAPALDDTLVLGGEIEPETG